MDTPSTLHGPTRSWRSLIAASALGFAVLLPAMLFLSARSLDTGEPGVEADGPLVTLPATGGGVFPRTWVINGEAIEFGTSEHTPLAGDVDADGDADPVIYDPATGLWTALVNGTEMPFAQLGQHGDQPMLGTFGVPPAAQPAVFRFRLGLWLFESVAPFTLGAPGDVAVLADFDGDGTDTPAVFRPSTGEWLTDAEEVLGTLGRRGDVPVAADFDGDGADDPAVFRASTGEWLFADGTTLELGRQGDLPVPADYDGDGTAEAAVYRSVTGEWLVFGQDTVRVNELGIPMPFDFDGDGAADRVVALTLPA